MIQLYNLSKAFGERVLLENVTWQITGRERVGLCGPNGAGKTTLLRMLAGSDEPDAGQIIRPGGLTAGYLPQDGLTHEGRTLLEEASSAFQPLLDLKAELHALEARLGDATIPADEHDRLLERYSECQDEFRHRDGYTIDLKVATVLRGLGFSGDDAGQRTETFSGGWQMRIALAKLLLGSPGLLLLDEPTNHLDLDARNWLEEYLADYPGAVIVVSHDRFFLDAVVTRITDIGLKTLTDYTGTYSEYLTERDARNWLEEFLADYPGAVIVVSHDRYFLDTVVTRITDIGLKTLTDYTGTYSEYLTERDARMERLRETKRRQDEDVARMKQFIDRFRYQAT